MATIEELLAALKALPQHFSALAPSQDAAQQADGAARLLNRLVRSVPPADVSRTWDTALERWVAADALYKKWLLPAAVHLVQDVTLCNGPSLLSLCRPVVAAAHSLALLAAAAAAALAQPGNVPLWLPGQVGAGCAVLASCAVLSRYAPQLSAQAAYRLGAACSLVLGPGCTVLEGCAAATQLLPEGAAFSFAGICRAQVAALAATLDSLLLPEHQPQAAAAFASSTANPAALLPWLASLSQAMSLVVATTGRGECAALLDCLSIPHGVVMHFAQKSKSYAWCSAAD